jgi:hypothetical protein
MVIKLQNPKEEFTKQRDILASKEWGQSMWVWLRKRATKLIEVEEPDLEEIGSSDVSDRLYRMWLYQYNMTGRKTINDSLGFQMNSIIQGYLWQTTEE